MTTINDIELTIRDIIRTDESIVSTYDSKLLCSDYETIILDIGSQIDDVWALLGQCVRIYMPEIDDTVSRAKMQQFESNMNALGYSGLGERIVRVQVPKMRSDQELRDFPGQLVRGKIGNYVRHLLAEET